MNTFRISASLLTAAALSLGFGAATTQTALAQYENFELAPGFLPDPLVGTGISGGSRSVEGCGFVDTADSPDHVLYIDAPFDYLRVYVDSLADVTLYMQWEETGEIQCVDDSNGTLLPEFVGEWPEGTFNIWVGDWGASEEYSIYITED